MMSRWGRLYGGCRNHRKIIMLREKFPSDWRAWYVLLDLAIENDDNGWIYVAPGQPYTISQLAKILSIKRAKSVQSFLNLVSLLDLCTINDKGILLNGFTDRNFISDCSTTRVRKYREKQKEETELERFENATETLPKRTRDRDRDREKHPLTPTSGGLETRENLGAEAKAKGTNPRATETNPRALKTNSRKDNGFDPDFEEWWKAYPGRRKQGKPVCLAKWKYLKKAGSLPPLPEMLSTLEAQKQGLDWIKDAGEFIPGPLPYLNQSKFLDESIPIREPTPKIRDPSCPRCRGSGLYQSGKMPDGSIAMTTCTCDNESPDGQAAAQA